MATELEGLGPLEIIEKEIGEKRELIKRVIEYVQRIPSVEYEKKGDEMYIKAEYAFVRTIYFNVRKEESLEIEYTNELKENKIEKRSMEKVAWDNTNNHLHELMKKKRSKSFVILINGTSGSGKSTLSCLLSCFLKITIILSTDIIREILRKYEMHNTLMRYSTYESWKIPNDEENMKKEIHRKQEEEKRDYTKFNSVTDTKYYIMKELEEKCVKNFLKQCDLLYPYIDELINKSIEKNEWLIIEGVHLSPHVIKKLEMKYPDHLVSFLVYIKNRETRVKRFLKRNTPGEETKNKYIENINYIDSIEKYLLKMCKEEVSSKVHNIENNTIQNSLMEMLHIILSQ